MRRGSETVLWAAAFSGSLAVHAALAAALALAPAVQESERKETTIVFHSAPEAMPENPTAPLQSASLAPAGDVAAAFDAMPVEASAAAETGTVAETPDIGAVVEEAATGDELIALDAATEATVPPGPEASAAAVDAATPLSGLEAGEAVAATAPMEAQAETAAPPEATAAAVDDPAPLASPAVEEEIAAVVGIETAEPVAPAAPQAIAGAADATAPLAAGVVAGATAAVASAETTQMAMLLPTAGTATGPAPIAPGVVTGGAASVALTDNAATATVSSVADASPTPRAVAVAQPAAPSAVSPAFAPAGSRPVSAVAAPGVAPVAVVAAPRKAVEPSAAVAVSAATAAPAQPALPVASVMPEQTIAAVRPLEPLVLSSRETPAEAYARLLDALAAEGGGSCFLALASARDEEIGVDGFSAEPERVERLGRRLGELIETPVEVRGHTVAATQCAALSFAGGLGVSREASLTVELAASRIENGGEIAGLVGNVTRPWFYLLVVDHSGKVQEIERDRLYSAGPGAVGFRVPLTRTGEPVDTVQLLLAIASDDILEMVWLREGQQAGAYFDDLRSEILRNGGSIDFGVAPFLLR